MEGGDSVAQRAKHWCIDELACQWGLFQPPTLSPGFPVHLFVSPVIIKAKTTKQLWEEKIMNTLSFVLKAAFSVHFDFNLANLQSKAQVSFVAQR